MRGNSIVLLALLLSAWPGLVGSIADSPQDHLLNLFPSRILDALALQDNETPPNYRRITDTNVLAQAGITRNPDYLTQRSGLEDVIQMNGVASFLALYGPGESVRLMVKGVFFRELRHALKYADVQRTRQRAVTAYQRDTPDGIWLLFIACDPDLVYDEQELLSITRGLTRYQHRLALSPLFDQINARQAD